MEGIKKIGQLKTNAKGRIEFTRKELREYMTWNRRDMMMVTLLSAIAWLMEDPEFKEDRPRLTSIFKNIQRIIETVLDPDNPFDRNALAKVVREGTDGEVDVRFYE